MPRSSKFITFFLFVKACVALLRFVYDFSIISVMCNFAKATVNVNVIYTKKILYAYYDVQYSGTGSYKTPQRAGAWSDFILISGVASVFVQLAMLESILSLPSMPYAIKDIDITQGNK